MRQIRRRTICGMTISLLRLLALAFSVKYLDSFITGSRELPSRACRPAFSALPALLARQYCAGTTCFHLLRLRGGVIDFEKEDDEEEEYADADEQYKIRNTWDEQDPTPIGAKFKEGDYVVPMDNDDVLSERTRRAVDLARDLEGKVDNVEAWWRTMDDKEVQREALQAWLDETSCYGTGPHTWIGYRFGGKKVRDRSLYAHDNETDEEMLSRHFFGWTDNSTLDGLYKLKIATECEDTVEIERLVREDGVDVNGLVDTMGEERAIHFAAWHGSLDTVRTLLALGAHANAKNFYNQTAMHRAAGGGFTAVCDELHKAGADPLLVDAFLNMPAEWAAMGAKNETCQWFYARFIDSNGTKFPRGPPPFYGLEQNIGYNHFSPFETRNNVTCNVFEGKCAPDPYMNNNTAEAILEHAEMKALENEELMADAEAAEQREMELRQMKAMRRSEMQGKREKYVRDIGPFYAGPE